MISTDEKIKLCLKSHMTLNDTIKVLDTSYRTLKPSWELLENKIRKKGMLVAPYGIPAKEVLDFFDIDLNRLMKLYEFEKKGVIQ